MVVGATFFHAISLNLRVLECAHENDDFDFFCISFHQPTDCASPVPFLKRRPSRLGRLTSLTPTMTTVYCRTSSKSRETVSKIRSTSAMSNGCCEKTDVVTRSPTSCLVVWLTLQLPTNEWGVPCRS